jgi:hypothetical protein
MNYAKEYNKDSNSPLPNRPYDAKYPSCFVPGTLVKTPEGDKKIEEVKKGDVVYAYDFDKNVIVEGIVTNTFKNWTYCLTAIIVENDIVISTRTHRFWIADKNEWIIAKDVKTDMLLMQLNNKIASVKFVETYPEISDTFNLKIEKYNNYFVGKEGILVHNGSDFENVDDGKSVKYYKYRQLEGHNPC